MRRTFLMVLMALVLQAARAQVVVLTSEDMKPGTACDKLKYRIGYDMVFVSDTARPDAVTREQMLLEIGSRVSKFYSYTVFQTDSVNKLVMERGDNNFVSGGKVLSQLYRGYPGAGRATTIVPVGNDRFKCEEADEEPSWTLVTDSVREVFGYRCNLATACFKGREWMAWYAADIPIDNGPWKLHGLPGLIMEACDAQGHYHFTVNGMQTEDSVTDIYYKGEGYEPVGRDELERLERRYYADPVGYISANPNIKVNITDGNGNKITKPMNIPYNPIER